MNYYALTLSVALSMFFSALTSYFLPPMISLPLSISIGILLGWFSTNIYNFLKNIITN